MCKIDKSNAGEGPGRKNGDLSDDICRRLFTRVVYRASVRSRGVGRLVTALQNACEGDKETYEETARARDRDGAVREEVKGGRGG